jgi:hypothetical protein
MMKLGFKSFPGEEWKRAMTALHIRLQKLLRGIKRGELERGHLEVDVKNLVVQIEACFTRTYRIGDMFSLTASQCSHAFSGGLSTMSRGSIRSIVFNSIPVFMQFAEPLDLGGFPYETCCSRVIEFEEILANKIQMSVTANFGADRVYFPAVFLIVFDLTVHV